jgi:magnesium transporter
VTAPRTLLQDVRPTAVAKTYSCYHNPQDGVQENLSRDQIAKAVASGQGTLWVDLDTRSGEQLSILSDVFHFHPLAIEEATNPEARVKLEEFDT